MKEQVLHLLDGCRGGLSRPERVGPGAGGEDVARTIPDDTCPFLDFSPSHKSNCPLAFIIN